MTKAPLNVRSYTDANGQPGVGVLRNYAARDQHAIIWLEEGDFRKYEPHELQQHGIVDLTDPGEPEPNDPEPAAEPENKGQDGASDAEKESSEPADESAGKPEGFVSEAQSIRDYLGEHPDAENQEVIDALAAQNIEISGSQVTRQRNRLQAS